MNAKSSIQKLSLSAIAVAAFAGTALAVAPTPAHAETFSRPGSGVLKSTDSGGTSAGLSKVGTGTLILPTTSAASDDTSLSLSFEKYETAFAEYGKDGANGGNVEFEWKVEEGESAPIVIDDLATVDDTEEVTGGVIPVYWHVIRHK